MAFLLQDNASHEQLPERYTTARCRLRVRKLSTSLGAEIECIDLSVPVTQDAFNDIYVACIVHGVHVFYGQDLAPAMHVDCSIRFGPLVGHVVSRFRLPGFPKVTLLSNVENGQG